MPLDTNTRYKLLYSFDNLNGKVKFLAANVVWQQKSTKQGFTARIGPQLMKTCTTKACEDSKKKLDSQKKLRHVSSQ